jgi:glycolate oxidase iron-sulfur subunit
MFDYSKVSNECVKCGKCKPVCTIFNVNQDEATSPRGFIDLLGAYQRGDLELDRASKDIFESCFLCTNCVDVCPNSLPTDMIIEQVRSDIAQKYGIAWYKKLFFLLLRNRKVMDFMAKMGYVFQSCAFKIDEQKNSMKAKISLPIVKKRALPTAKSETFLNKYPTEIKGNGKKRVAIFIGCMANYSYTSIGDSLVEILKKLEVDIFIPKKQLCCAAPAYFTGDFTTVDKLTKKNIEYFESFIDDVDAIIIPEATCSAMIKEDWERYFHNQDSWHNRTKKIVDKVYMATEWLYKETNLKDILSDKKFDESVTYHDPCHAKKVLGVYKEPRELISKNFEIKEMSDSNRCCGFGGVTIQSEKHHLASAAGKPKAKMIQDTKASYVSAECSACRMQLTNSLDESGVDVTFKHPLELIAQGLK